MKKCSTPWENREILLRIHQTGENCSQEITKWLWGCSAAGMKGSLRSFMSQGVQEPWTQTALRGLGVGSHSNNCLWAPEQPSGPALRREKGAADLKHISLVSGHSQPRQQGRWRAGAPPGSGVPPAAASRTSLGSASPAISSCRAWQPAVYNGQKTSWGAAKQVSGHGSSQQKTLPAPQGYLTKGVLTSSPLYTRVSHNLEGHWLTPRQGWESRLIKKGKKPQGNKLKWKSLLH